MAILQGASSVAQDKLSKATVNTNYFLFSDASWMSVKVVMAVHIFTADQKFQFYI